MNQVLKLSVYLSVIDVIGEMFVKNIQMVLSVKCP